MPSQAFIKEQRMNDIGHDPLRRAAPAAWYINSGLRLNDEEPDADIEPRRYALVPALEQYLASVRYGDEQSASRAATLDALRARGMDWLPLPGRGETATRWRGLAAVAACDLSLVKLYEAHTDALAILAELDRAELADDGNWAVWAAEPPNAKLIARASGGGDALTLEGKKPWCSGAPHVSHALVTAWRDDEPVLAAVELSQPSISIDSAGWQAVGMRATGTSSVRFDGARAVQIGDVGAYLSRPGFWHGGAGIAACWYGCAAALASILRDSVKRHANPHACAHLGAADAELSAVAALLRESAAWIDAHPRDDAQQCALRVRVAVEQAAGQVMEHVSRALGAVPFCTDAWFAHAIADLPVFLRQSHAERDECALGQTLLEDSDGADHPWNLGQP
jgi:alkylation response protein AidB-like acyl-CoA dehydrogenase